MSRWLLCSTVAPRPFSRGHFTTLGTSDTPRDGARAAALIPRIEAAIAAYPHQRRGSYTVWPGPNSNTFVAWVVRNSEGFGIEMPPAAVGKDYLGMGIGAAPAASGTGIVLSIAGVLGLTLALREGLELNLLGSSIGIDPDDLAARAAAGSHRAGQAHADA